MKIFRERPHWYALSFEYGLAFVAAWHLGEDLLHGQWKVYSGEFYPWRQTFDMNASHYAVLVAVEAIALLLFVARIGPRWCAAVIAAVLFVDNLGSFLNHRLLMAIEFFAVALLPVQMPARGCSYRESKVYWNLDLIRYQLSLVYLASALHKLNEEFLSGRTLQNLFWMTHHHGMKTYPDWLLALVEQPSVCILLAWITIAVELTLAVGLNLRRSLGGCLLLAVVFHLAMAVLMAYIKIFAALVIVSLIVFVPDRTLGMSNYVLIRRSSTEGPRHLLRLLWPGYLANRVDPSLDVSWKLILPNGEDFTGYDAWVELLSLSPITIILSEILRRRTPLAQPERKSVG